MSSLFTNIPMQWRSSKPNLGRMIAWPREPHSLIRSTIEFTMEMEEGGSLHFLDTKATRKEDGKLDITVYHKQMHTDRYLHFRSHHPTL